MGQNSWVRHGIALKLIVLQCIEDKQVSAHYIFNVNDKSFYLYLLNFVNQKCLGLSSNISSFGGNLLFFYHDSNKFWLCGPV